LIYRYGSEKDFGFIGVGIKIPETHQKFPRHIYERRKNRKNEKAELKKNSIQNAIS
jgi:hypothetical protein